MAAVESKFLEIYATSTDPDLSETGGGHGQKGVDFQRFWAIIKMFELKEAGQPDFLILFESIQDVAELDSETAPTTIDLYQIKKKDSGEWTFNSLTKLPKPNPKKSNTLEQLQAIKDSPIGKLYLSGLSFKLLKSTVHFVSNAGCDIPLSTSGSASKLLSCSANELDADYIKSLTEGLSLLHEDCTAVPNLEGLRIQKTTIHPDDPVRLVLGAAFEYLSKNMAPHNGQAKSLVDALFMQVSSLGRKTEPVHTYDELKRQRGFSKKDMDAALNALNTLPDIKKHFDMMLNSLSLPVFEKIGIDVAAAKYFSNIVAETLSTEDEALIDDCIQISANLSYVEPLLPTLKAEVAKLKLKYGEINESDIFAFLLVQVTKYAATKF